MYCGAQIHGVPHVGARGLGATGGYDRSLEIWKTLAAKLAAPLPHPQILEEGMDHD
jgi:hypothetical protein